MALRAALVDRGRIVRSEATGPRIMGTTARVPVAGPWFRVRLEIPMGAENASGEEGLGGGRRSATKRPRIMFDVIDEEGDRVEVSFTDKLEIDSPQLGRATWRVTATPQPIRKKRTVIGWEVTLERVVERRVDDERSVAEQEA